MKFENFSYEIKDKVCYIGFGFNSDKSMPILTEGTLKELDEALDDVKSKQKSEIDALIFHSHKEAAFLAGADINLISSLQTESEAASGAEQGQNIFNKIEDLKIPSVALVQGVCLGGGLELALSCTNIVASDDRKTVLGLPEVQLGIIPGFGGTYRLPKKVGLPTALDMILSGKKVPAKKAYKLGLVAAVYPKENLLKMADRHFKKQSKDKNFKESLGDFAMDNFVTRKLIFQKARESVLKKTKGFYNAPLKILDVMENGQSKGRSGYLSSEAQAFGELAISSQSKNLQHIFFLMDSSKKYTGPKASGELKKINTGAVLGAGTMGGGIAWLFAQNNQRPIMKDLNKDALELGLKQASSNFKGALVRKKMTEEEFERAVRSITPTTTFDEFNNVDLVIEAIVENMDIKKKVFSELEKHVTQDCLITSNTSSLSVQEMSTAFEKPERFAGLHFFNPVNKMPLVEIITHDKTSPETTEALYNWVLKSKKTPIIVKDGPGFLVNRILMPFMNEAMFLLEEGVSIDDVDQACLNFGMPMGPCRLMDEVGIDVGAKVAKIIHDGLGDRMASGTLSSKIAESGLLGRKSSKGFYVYDDNGKSGGVNDEILAFLPKKSKTYDERELQMRIFLPMINEASYILDEKIVETASEVDLGLIFGIGFPPFRGGLLKYADSEGIERLVDAMKEFSGKVNEDRYRPSPFLLNLVEQKKKFYDI